MEKKLKILLADDEEDQLAVFKDTLEEVGYEVITSVDGERTLELIRSEEPELLILDIKLPKISGEDILKIVLKQNLAPRMKVLVMTGFYDYDLTRNRIESFFGQRIVGYLQKPVDINQFSKMISSALKREESSS